MYIFHKVRQSDKTEKAISFAFKQMYKVSVIMLKKFVISFARKNFC